MMDKFQFGDPDNDYTETRVARSILHSTRPDIGKLKNPDNGLKKEEIRNWLQEELQSCTNQGTVVRRGLLDQVHVPFSDIYITGALDRNSSLKRNLTRMLNDENALYTKGFNIIVNNSTASTMGEGRDNYNNQMIAFFGLGVYCPPEESKQVADLEFCGRDPIQHPEVKPATARLPHRTGGKLTPAAWYAGQFGIAISFNKNLAPAKIDEVDLKFENSPPPDLNKLILFFGKYSPIMAPVVKAYMSSDNGLKEVSITVDGKSEEFWDSNNPRWRKIHILDLKLNLWFRYTNRMGGQRFTQAKFGELKQKANGDPMVTVEGIVLPKIPVLSTRLKALARGWRVDFDDIGEIRTSELMPRFQTLVAGKLRSFALFRYKGNEWATKDSSKHNEMEFVLTDERSISIRELSLSSHFKKRADTRRFRAIYPKKVYGRIIDILAPAGEESFGGYVLPRKFESYEFSVSPQSSITNMKSNVISLDWLNRAATVDIGHETGLASYLFSNYEITTNIEKRTVDNREVTSLKVTTSLRGTPITATEYIDDGNAGFLGPLWVAFYAGNN